jgi:4-hydroxy-2-oxoglutarate aldolase
MLLIYEVDCIMLFRGEIIMHLQGIYAPIPTPFAKSGGIAPAELKSNLRFWNSSPLTGLVVGGSNGEFALLSAAERLETVRLARENLAPDKVLIAGTGCESTTATIDLSVAAAAEGAEAVLVVNPHYYKGSYDDDALETYYRRVADGSPVPLILYNMPGNTGLNLSVPLVSRLSRHPNIAGLKDSSGNIVQIGEIIASSDSGFAVFAGSASFLLPTLLLGGTGGTMALANVLPEQCCRIQALAQAGEWQSAAALQLGLLAINAAVTRRWGIPGLKAAMDMSGLRGGEPRPPLLPLKKSCHSELKTLLEAARAL